MPLTPDEVTEAQIHDCKIFPGPKLGDRYYLEVVAVTVDDGMGGLCCDGSAHH